MLLAVAVLLMALVGLSGRRDGAGQPGPLDPALIRTVNINHAASPTLCLLPGIGPRLADRIIAARGQSGPITDLEDLQAVKGIGPGIARDIARYIRFQ